MVDTDSSNFNTLLAVYTGSSVSALTLVASNDDDGSTVGASEVTFDTVAGQTYRELLDEYASHEALLEETRSTYRAWREAAAQLEELTGAQRDRALRLFLGHSSRIHGMGRPLRER